MGLSTSCGYRTMDGLSRSRGMEEWSMSRGTRQPMGLTCMPFWAPRRVCAGRCLLKGELTHNCHSMTEHSHVGPAGQVHA